MLRFEHRQEMNLEWLVGRAISASYVPKSGAAWETLVELLTDLFKRHRDARGLVGMRYETRVYLAERR